jgi:SAM-dependent methyltransferase
MSGFSHEWLALREGADYAARNSVLTNALVDRLVGVGHGLRILDLGAGAGANLRYLAPRLGAGQQWRLVDHDATLLARLPTELCDWAHTQGYRITNDAEGLLIEGRGFTAAVCWIRFDLATSLADLPFGQIDLVTASALLDLVSAEWIDSLALACLQNACAVLFALNYDGRIQWRPALAADTAVSALLNRHQRRDKGLGQALGPDAAHYAAERFGALGFEVYEGRSDWRLDAVHNVLQQALAADWARAAAQFELAAKTWIDPWLGARIVHAQRGDSQLTVGNIDILALA